MAAGAYRAPDGRTVAIAAAVEAARTRTWMYGPDAVDVPPTGQVTGVLEVTGESSPEAARRLVGRSGDPVAVLNFASASPKLSTSFERGTPIPGGGAPAQVAGGFHRLPAGRRFSGCWGRRLTPGLSSSRSVPSAGAPRG